MSDLRVRVLCRWRTMAGWRGERLETPAVHYAREDGEFGDALTLCGVRLPSNVTWRWASEPRAIVTCSKCVKAMYR